ncbi:recombination protein O N-terminal domain-containing protein, partial [Patescibacteria group bacterium]|nr:recombination protein O N-terminal domain-containing protein [Patescibacteria group bacterium]
MRSAKIAIHNAPTCGRGPTAARDFRRLAHRDFVIKFSPSAVSGYPFVNKLPVYKTEGIILKSADWGDLDRLLTIYTRGYGKIQARAISARKRDSKLN